MSLARETLPSSAAGYYSSAPPAPPPKHVASFNPSQGPPPPPLPPGRAEHGPSELDAGSHDQRHGGLGTAQPDIPPIASNWLPDILLDKSTQELQALIADSTLQSDLLSAPRTTHPAIIASQNALEPLIKVNIDLSTATLELEARLGSLREQTQSQLMALRALKQQHETKMQEAEAAVWDFSPMALKQRLNASVQEQHQLLRSLEDSWLDEDGLASEREVSDFVRHVKDAKRTAFLRHERKGRWDEARVGGWR